MDKRNRRRSCPSPFSARKRKNNSAEPGIRFADNIREGGNHRQGGVVRFYNARDKGGFSPAEAAANVNRKEMGDLSLTATEENAEYF